jgi:hypothetical protein
LCDQNAVIVWPHNLLRGGGGGGGGGGGAAAAGGSEWCVELKPALARTADPPSAACICPATGAGGKKGGLIAVFKTPSVEVRYWSNVGQNATADRNYPMRFDKEGDKPLKLMPCEGINGYILLTTYGEVYKITLVPGIVAQRCSPIGGFVSWGMSLFGAASAAPLQAVAAVVQIAGQTNQLHVLTSASVQHWVLGQSVATTLERTDTDGLALDGCELLDMIADETTSSLHILKRRGATFSIGTQKHGETKWEFAEVEDAMTADPMDAMRLVSITAVSALGLIDTRQGKLMIVEKSRAGTWVRHTDADASVDWSDGSLEGIFGYAPDLDGETFVVTGRRSGSVCRLELGDAVEAAAEESTSHEAVVQESAALLNQPLADQDWAKSEAKTKGVSQLRKKQLVGLRDKARALVDRVQTISAEAAEAVPSEVQDQLLKNCELISATIGLRKHQETCAKRAVPGGEGVDDRSHTIMLEAIRKTVAKRVALRGAEYGQDDNDVFYAGGELDKIGEFLEHLVEASKDSTGSGRVSTKKDLTVLQAVNGIIKAMVEESEKEHPADDTSAPPLLWTADPQIRKNLLDQHRETKKVMFSGRAGAPVHELKEDLFQLGQWALDSFAAVVGFGGDNAGPVASSALKTEYAEVREEVISAFADEDNTKDGLDRAHDLASRHKDYKTLVKLCENFDEEEQLEQYSEDFKQDPRFAKEKFQWWFENGKRDKLLEFGQKSANAEEMKVLQQFFDESATISSRATIQWLHAIQNGKFGDAAKVLRGMAKEEMQRTPGNVARLKTLRSLQKLSIAADGGSQIQVDETNRALELIQCQRYLMDQYTMPLPAEDVVRKLAETEPQTGSEESPIEERVLRSTKHVEDFMYPALECWAKQCRNSGELLREVFALAVKHDRGHLERSRLQVEESMFSKMLQMYIENFGDEEPTDVVLLGCETPEAAAALLVESKEFCDINGSGSDADLISSISEAMERARDLIEE